MATFTAGVAAWRAESTTLLAELERRLANAEERLTAAAAAHAAARLDVKQLGASVRALRTTLACVGAHEPASAVLAPPASVRALPEPPAAPAVPAGPAAPSTPALDAPPRSPGAARPGPRSTGRIWGRSARETDALWSSLPLSSTLAPLDPTRLIWPLPHTSPTCRDLVTLWLRAHGFRLVVGEAAAFFASQGYYRDVEHATSNLSSLVAQRLTGWTRPEKGVYLFHEVDGCAVGPAPTAAVVA